MLPICEDTAFLMRLAACARWLPGQLNKPVSMRRVHEENRTTGCAKERALAQRGWRSWRERMAVWMVVFRWLNRQVGQEAKMRLILTGVRRDSGNLVAQENNGRKRSVTLVRCLSYLLCHEPRFVRDRAFLRGFAKDIYYALRNR